MNLTLMQLFLILALGVAFVLPILYSIVITVLFVESKRKIALFEKACDSLSNEAKKLMDEAKGSKSGKNKIKAGFALPEADINAKGDTAA